MRFAQRSARVFGFTEEDWTDPERLRAKVHGTVAHYRPLFTSPERGGATFAALHVVLTEALAAGGVPDPEAVARELLLQVLDQGGIEPAGA
jgi:hypothetical protein